MLMQLHGNVTANEAVKVFYNNTRISVKDGHHC